MRYPAVAPGDVPAELAARRMGLDKASFETALPQLQRRGFPLPDPDTGLYDLDAIEAWRRRRHAHLYGDMQALTALPTARDAADVVASRLARLRNG